MIPLIIGAVVVVGLVVGTVVGTAHAASKAETGKKDSGPQTTERERKSGNADGTNPHGNEQKATTEISERNKSTTGKSSSIQTNGGTAKERRTPSVTSDTDAPTQDGKIMSVTTTNDDPVPDVRRVSPRVENRGKERSFTVSRHDAPTPESSTIPMKPPVQEKRTPSNVSKGHVSPKERSPKLTAEKEPVPITQDKLTSSIHRKKSKDKAPAQTAVWESLNSDLISREILAWQNEGSTGQNPEPMLAGSAINITDEVHVNSGSTVPETPSNAITAYPPAAQAKPTDAENPRVPVVPESGTTPPETMSNTQTVASQSALSQQVSGSKGQDTIPNEQYSAPDHALTTLSSSRAMPQDPPIPKDIPSSPPESKIKHSPDLLSSSPEMGSPMSTTDFTSSPATSITVASSSKKKSADASSDTPSHVEKPRQFSMDVIDPTVPSLKKGRVSPSVKSSSSSVHSERRPSSIASVARNTSRSFKRLVKGSSADGSKPQNGVSSPSVESLASTKGKERTPSIASTKRSNSWKLWKKNKNPNESVESLASVDHQPSPLVSGSTIPAVVGSEQAQATPAVVVETPKPTNYQPVPATASESDRPSPLKKRFGLLGSKSSKTNLRQAALKNAYEKGR